MITCSTPQDLFGLSRKRKRLTSACYISAAAVQLLQSSSTMTLVELGVSRQANAFYRTANGARHERNWPAAHQYVRKQQLCRVIRAQVESKYQSDLSDKSVKSGSTPAYQVSKYNKATSPSSPPAASLCGTRLSVCIACCRGPTLPSMVLLRGLFSKQLRLAGDMQQLLFLQRW